MKDNTAVVITIIVMGILLLLFIGVLRSCVVEQHKINSAKEIEISKIIVPQEYVDELKLCEQEKVILEHNLDIEREYSVRLKNRIEHLEECRSRGSFEIRN